VSLLFNLFVVKIGFLIHKFLLRITILGATISSFAPIHYCLVDNLTNSNFPQLPNEKIPLPKPAADRWLLSQFAINGGSGPWDECVAISQGPDATGEHYTPRGGRQKARRQRRAICTDTAPRKTASAGFCRAARSYSANGAAPTPDGRFA
jgi:hypothetical protein